LVGGWALARPWLFRIAPIIGAVPAGFVYKGMAGKPEA
jgi:glycerol uptake facilitator-like aquaporin